VSTSAPAMHTLVFKAVSNVPNGKECSKRQQDTAYVAIVSLHLLCLPRPEAAISHVLVMLLRVVVAPVQWQFTASASARVRRHQA
jgi:hypothetical protein